MSAEGMETETAAATGGEGGEGGGALSCVNNYRVLRLLGEGTFSRVYECERGDGRRYALKVLNKSFLKRKREYKRVDGKLVLSNAFQKVQKEVAIMKKLAHAHLVKLHEVIDSPADDKLFLVLDLIRGGQVMDWDDKAFRYRSAHSDTGVLGRSAVRACLRDVVSALDYLHRNRICHRDIKPENILLSSAEEGYKLADFGVAHMLAPEESGEEARLRSTEGTYHFLAPECTTGEAYDPFQVDTWALGVTMFALLRGSLPFGAQAASLDAVMAAIRDEPLALPADLAPECRQLLARMLDKDPAARITIPQLVAHPWLSGEEDEPPAAALVDCGGGGEGDGGGGRAVDVVHVSAMEIEAAFTPVNNFILMTKLKMKLGSRLARARRSIDSRQVLVGNGGAHAHVHARRAMPTPTPTPTPLCDRPSACAVAPLALTPVDEDDKAAEVSPTEKSPAKVGGARLSPGSGLQKRKSSLPESLATTKDALATLRPDRLLRRKSAQVVSATAEPPCDAATDSSLGSQASSQCARLDHADPFTDLEAVSSGSVAASDAAEKPADDAEPLPLPLPQTRAQRPRLLRQSSTTAVRHSKTKDASGPEFSDISGGPTLARRKSALGGSQFAHAAGGRPRGGSPPKATRLEKLDERPGRQPPDDRVDPREETGASTEPAPATASGAAHEEDGSRREEAAAGRSTSTLAALPLHHELADDASHAIGVGDGDSGRLSPRPRSPPSPRGRNRLASLSPSPSSSHPPAQSKLPPLDLSPSVSPSPSPVTSPLASSSSKRPRRATVDLPLGPNEADELAAHALATGASPNRRNSLLEHLPAGREHVASPSSPRTETRSIHSSVELSLSRSPSVRAAEEGGSGPPSPEVSTPATTGSSRLATPPSTSLSPTPPTPHPPHRLVLDALPGHSSPEREPSRTISVGSLSPRSKLSSPGRTQSAIAPAPVPGALDSASSTDPTVSIVRTTSLFKALEGCLPPERRPRGLGGVDPPQIGAAQRSISRRRSLLEAQDSLKLVIVENGRASPSRAADALKWLGRGAKSDSSHVCAVM